MADFKFFWERLTLSTVGDTVVSFENGAKFMVKKIDSKLWQVDAEIGNFSILEAVPYGTGKYNN